MAKVTAMMTDQAAMAADMVKAQATFDAADTNSNGKLNETEWFDFCKKNDANQKAAGYHVIDSTDEELKKAYDILVKVGGDSEGVPLDTVFGVMAKVWGEIMAAQWWVCTSSLNSSKQEYKLGV